MPGYRTWIDDIRDQAMKEGWPATQLSVYVFNVLLPKYNSETVEVIPDLTEEDVSRIAVENFHSYMDFIKNVTRAR